MVSCGAQKEDQAPGSEVPYLRASASNDCLDVIDVGFGFDHGVERRSQDRPVGTPKVAGRRHRDFDAEAQARCEVRSQSVKQRQLCGVAHWRSARMEGDAHLQPKDCSYENQSLQFGSAARTSLDPADRLVRRADTAT